MMSDLWTVIWKEWRELFARQGRLRGGAVNFVLVLAVFGIVMPWQFGRAWVDSPMMVIYWGWVPLTLLSTVVVDAFAGERERHTLETLLASRLPDRAILFGKMLSAIAYAIAVTLGSLVLGLVTTNAIAGEGRWLMYPTATLVGAVVTSLLGSSLIAALGVLVSLRSASVRQASQLMGAAILVVAFLPVLALRALTAHWKAQAHVMSPGGTMLLGLAALGAFLVIDAGLVGAALMRFRRSRLLLD
jgi:ABC-2 type transport system permease protein